MSASNKVIVIDAGNTALKWTLFIDQQISEKWVGDKFPKFSPDYFVLASVRSADHDNVLLAELKKHYSNIPIMQIKSERKVCGLLNSYEEPERLGVDRWLAAIAAYTEHKNHCVVVDAGTAIKIEFVAREGIHQGGYIAPGLDLMRDSLLEGTAKIRFDEAEVSEGQMIPCSTADAVNQGCLQMALGFVQRIYADHSEALWIATGGSSERLMSLLDIPCMVDEHLVAKGAFEVFKQRLSEAI